MVLRFGPLSTRGLTAFLYTVGQHLTVCTVRLLTHVLCKPTHFFFHSFIVTMSYSLQISFNSIMKDWADQYHVWGTPTRPPSRSNSRLFKHAFFHTIKEHIHTCSYIISVIYIYIYILYLVWRGLPCLTCARCGKLCIVYICNISTNI